MSRPMSPSDGRGEAVNETAHVFGCAGESLVGVLSTGPASTSNIAVVIVVGGPQYRIGSHRQFVLLARALAGAGHACLRFDHRGMGDGSGEAAGFEHIDEDIGAAVDLVLQLVPSARQVVLWGLCDGASGALLHWERSRDPRIGGLCLANPWVRSQATLARTHLKHYYLQRLLQREFWIKLLKGQVGDSALAGVARSAALANATVDGRDGSYQAAMARAWKKFDAPMLLLLSDNDYTAREFEEHVKTAPTWADALEHPRLTRHVVTGDHTFSDLAARASMQAITLDWLTSIEARHPSAPGCETPRRAPVGALSP